MQVPGRCQQRGAVELGPAATRRGQQPALEGGLGEAVQQRPGRRRGGQLPGAAQLVQSLGVGGLQQQR
ncbi:MAG: hypothetical protein WKG07_42670 [Hymenobacter sp.]